MKKIKQIIFAILTGLLILIIAGGFVWYGEINAKNIYQDSEIKSVGEKTKMLKDKCVNIESMVRSNDNAIDEIKTDVAVIKVKMVTKNDLYTLKRDLINEIRTINNMSYE